eukprot:1955858-Pyramimonas_sp.AAC.1
MSVSSPSETGTIHPIHGYQRIRDGKPLVSGPIASRVGIVHSAISPRCPAARGRQGLVTEWGGLEGRQIPTGKPAFANTFTTPSPRFCFSSSPSE